MARHHCELAKEAIAISKKMTKLVSIAAFIAILMIAGLVCT